MLIGPIFFIFASSTAVFIVEYIERGVRILPIAPWAVTWVLFLVNLIPYCLFWILFTFIYLFMPNIKVQFRSAMIAGLFAACFYLFVQWAYIYFQIGVNRYGAIYGSMAALPLFLIWLQASWILFLFGAEISYAHQTLEEHEYEGMVEKMSPQYKRLLSLWILHLIVTQEYITLNTLTQIYRIPPTLTRMILPELLRCELIHETRGGYVPALKTPQLTLAECIDLLESKGLNHFPFIDAKSLSYFEKTLLEFRKVIESSPLNTRIVHVPNTF
jgi:membrane protein